MSRARRRAWWHEREGVLILTARDVAAMRDIGEGLVPYSRRATVDANERASCCQERAGYHRWVATKAARRLAAGAIFPGSLLAVRSALSVPVGNDGLTGIPWDRCDGQRSAYDGVPAPTAVEAVELGRVEALAAGRYWLRRAAGWRQTAHFRGEGV